MITVETSPKTLKKSVIGLIRINQRVRNRLQLAFNKSYPTIQRYFDSNHPLLTSATALTIISEELAIPKEQLLEQ